MTASVATPGDDSADPGAPPTERVSMSANPRGCRIISRAEFVYLPARLGYMGDLVDCGGGGDGGCSGDGGAM